jgi:hypothetical protein
VLIVEAVRCLGFGARLASGYTMGTNPPDDDAVQTTHAWAEMFIPGAGWIPFDPTNNTFGGGHLIPVAVGRDIGQITPVSGSYNGGDQDLIEMSAEVLVKEQPRRVVRENVEAYRSGNGDVWQVRQNEHGHISVRHIPNPASGGGMSDVSIDDFLAIQGSGPEHRSVREIAAKFQQK